MPITNPFADCRSWKDCHDLVTTQEMRLRFYPLLCAALLRAHGATDLSNDLFRDLQEEVRTGTTKPLLMAFEGDFAVVFEGQNPS